MSVDCHQYFGAIIIRTVHVERATVNTGLVVLELGIRPDRHDRGAVHLESARPIPSSVVVQDEKAVCMCVSVIEKDRVVR